MARKKSLRRKQASKKKARIKADDIKFQLSLDATYGLSRRSLFNMARSYGASKKKARSYSRALDRGRSR